MTLEELKQLVKEEYQAYSTKRTRKNEQAMPDMGMGADAAMGGPGGPPEPSIAVSDDDIDVMGGKESPEETLRDIFDMLKDYFEGGDKPSAPKAPSAKKDDDKGDDKPKAPKAPKKDDDKGDDKPKGKEKDDEDDKEKDELQERFQKLANIIKG